MQLCGNYKPTDITIIIIIIDSVTLLSVYLLGYLPLLLLLLLLLLFLYYFIICIFINFMQCIDNCLPENTMFLGYTMLQLFYIQNLCCMKCYFALEICFVLLH